MVYTKKQQDVTVGGRLVREEGSEKGKLVREEGSAAGRLVRKEEGSAGMGRKQEQVMGANMITIHCTHVKNCQKN